MKKIQHNNSNNESYIKNNLINVQGLTQTKVIELEDMLRQNEITCLTETQQKIEKNRFKNSAGSMTMRRKKEKKGGGLMIMYKKKHVIFQQYVTRNNNNNNNNIFIHTLSYSKRHDNGTYIKYSKV